MDTENYFTSLGQELEALKSRVRNMLPSPHWQTDGEWKESVVRQSLRRSMPSTVLVGRGFVVSGADASHQIDVLVHDGTRPVIFRDGDLAFVTPDAVLGIIEVKTRCTPGSLREAASKLAHDIELVRRHPNGRAFAAFFAFDVEAEQREALLDAASDSADSWNQRLDFGAIGPNLFLKYWNEDPNNPHRRYESWHLYDLPGRSFGYFIHNAVNAVSPESVNRNQPAWFPAGGKEPFVLASRKGRWA